MDFHGRDSQAMVHTKPDVSVFAYRGFKAAVVRVGEHGYKARAVRLRDSRIVIDAAGTSRDRARRAIKRQINALIDAAIARRLALLESRRRATRMLWRVTSGELPLSSVQNYGRWLTDAQRKQLFQYILEKGPPGEALDPGFPLSAAQRRLLAVTMYIRRMTSAGRTPALRPRTRAWRHRTPRCYACKRRLDNAVDCECDVCGWIICVCGACGCGSGFSYQSVPIALPAEGDQEPTFDSLFG